MKRRQNEPKIHLVDFKWLFIVDSIIIVAAVISFGVVAALYLDLNKNNALAMLYIIPMMIVALLISSFIILHSVRRKMGVLLDGIKQVSKGDLNVCLDVNDAGEYADVYRGFNGMVMELNVTKNEMQNFIDEFTHEFKTPITSICGFAEYLLKSGKETESAERMKYLKVIYDESMRLSELSKNSLILSKVEACQIVTDKQEFSLSEQIKNSAILLLPKIEHKKIALIVDIPEINYFGNAELMEQVWLNLIGNAVKFTPENGEISLYGSDDGELITINVEDNGIGMDDETVQHIFKKYYQNDTVHSVRGNGIGLSIVKRIVTLCGGSIDVFSKKGEGSRFTVTLKNVTTQRNN